MIKKQLPFRPSSLVAHPHLQTIGAAVMLGPRSERQAVKRLVVLEDGDRIIVHDDQPRNWITGDRVAILFHGLCGDHSSPCVVRIAMKLRRRGIRTIRVDLRGFGDSVLISRHHLYAGCSHDVFDIVRFVHRLSPLSKISLIGFSLGAGIVLKTVGEWADQHPVFVDSAVAVSPPVDLVQTSTHLRRFGNRIYDHYFLQQLKSNLTMRRRKVLGLIDNGLNPLPERLVHFDDQFTAPLWGFRGARDYYETCSSGPLLARVRVPTTILTSRDDPVVPFEMFANFPMSGQIDFVVTKRGGHLGFIGRRNNDPDRHWMDWRICHWIDQVDE